MKKKITLLFISLFTFMIVPINAQYSGSNEHTISDLREQLNQRHAEIKQKQAEIKRKRAEINQNINVEIANGVICYGKTLYTNLPPMNNGQFLDYCTKEISKLKQQSGFPSNIDDHVITSCYQEKGMINAHFCVLSIPNTKPSIDEQMRMSKEKQLTKIRNTKKMYQDMIAALNNEVSANKIEIAESASDLALKHLDMKEFESYRPIIEEGKDQTIDALKEKYGLGGHTSSKNEVADALNEGIAFAEDVASVIPGGDKVTCHYLWRIFKSTPELGKMIGNGAATITITFQRREYENKLKELERQEQLLLSN
ncbi:MAG: hypothetical protein J5524_10000 [Bacteroidaceae bacterium]|nr:hypothetical protein [Bacteroidaceae bacterium]